MLSASAAFNHLDCLKFAHEVAGCALDYAAFSAASNGHMECLMYLVEHGCPLTGEAWDFCDETYGPVPVPQRTGVYECFVYAIEHGAEAVPDMYTTAVLVGSLDFLRYLHERGVRWNTMEAHFAAVYGQVRCLRFLLEHGCPCSTDCYGSAIDQNSLECVNCLHEHGVMWNSRSIFEVVEQDKPRILRYLLQNGCPCDLSWLRAAAIKWGFVECVHCIDEHALTYR